MKLIATDLDGTLLNERGNVSEENAEAIRKALSQGIQVIVATGRSYDAANQPLQEVGLTLPIISLNGAKTYSQDQTVLRDKPMQLSVCKRIQSICEKEDMYFEVFTNKGIYSISRDDFKQVIIDIMITAHPNISREELHVAVDQRFQDEKVQFTNDFDHLFNDLDLSVYKILAFSLSDEVLQRVRNQFEEDSNVKITSSGSINLEFNDPQAQKGIALSLFAKSMSIDMKDVMALGDNYNDLSMLTLAGRGVAMGNADEAIKKQCDFTTKVNNEHGVAHAIEEMLKEVNV
ncbi:Cof-type HAD-IIB family hydrolase [Ornithinibacillus caprae]|uniref:Cof-type HAD-IIB family hydrolase n=1 Tax=Ornithinibacillus caprae TaxID=2678566 RepID=UPI0012D9B10B|nr:Cof-type HAD-IIB family hydrolase [Ornithinibacillus caprae]